MAALRAKDFTPGVPVDAAFLSTDPKEVPSYFGDGSQLMFRTTIGALYLDADPARDICEQVAKMGIRPNEPVRIVKVATTHGGHRWTVLRPQDLQRQLEESITHTRNVQPIRRGAADVQERQTPAAERVTNSPDHNAIMSKLCAAMMTAIDVAVESKSYAARRGMVLDFSEESIRCLAITAFINTTRDGGGR